MKKRIIVSGGDELRVFWPEDLELVRRVPLEASGVMCAGKGALYCAAQNGSVIWRLDSETLTPCALFAGGPGIGDLLLSGDGTRLYALCGEADSVLLLDAASGMPLLLNFAGLSPTRMAIDERAGILAVAAGERGSVLLMRAQTLACLKELPMPGPVYDVALHAGTMYALCLSETLQSLLVMIAPDGQRITHRLSGMPGALLARAGRMFAAVEDGVYVFDGDGACTPVRMPGRASRMALAQGRLLLLDRYTEAIFADACGGRALRVCTQAKDMVVL